MNKDIIGKKFGRLTVKELSHKDKNGKRYYYCVCDCGNETTVLEKNLISGNTKSCGCLWKEIIQKTRTKHGLRNTRIYGIWYGILQRIKNKNKRDYKNYGGRGIGICDEWKENFLSFYNWSIKNGYKDGLSIDRINNDGNYCPENCRWVTYKEQARNTRKNNMITYNGETHCATEWEDILGYKRGLIYSRIHLGWTLDKIMTTRSRQEGKLTVGRKR